MRTRHRIPSIFNLSMVDVLCCALGCVILLWLLNLRDARERSDQASHATEQLTAAVGERDSLARDLRARQTELDAVLARLAALRKTADETSTQLATTRTRLQSTEEEVRAIAAALAGTKSDRDADRKKLASLAELIAALEQRKADLEALLKSLGTQKADAEQALARKGQAYIDLEKLLAAANERITKLQVTADLVPGLQGDLKSLRDKSQADATAMKALDKQAADREKELADARKRIEELLATKDALEKDVKDRDRDLAAAKGTATKLATAGQLLDRMTREIEERNRELTKAGQRIESLQGEATRARAASENRFAGVNLTGRRVIFLIDTSGSMNGIDPKTEDGSKWPGVCETVVRILRSLPELEKFQVITFAEKPTFLQGDENSWLDYDPKKSAEQVEKALAAIKPEGGTNMYIALEDAFRFRAAGLDTLYLFSDGLPNMGEGLPPGIRSLKEGERGDLLGRVIRRTLTNEWNRPIPGRPRVRINSIGFFYESPDLGAFLWALARENDGSFVGMSKP